MKKIKKTENDQYIYPNSIFHAFLTKKENQSMLVSRKQKKYFNQKRKMRYMRL